MLLRYIEVLYFLIARFYLITNILQKNIYVIIQKLLNNIVLFLYVSFYNKVINFLALCFSIYLILTFRNRRTYVCVCVYITELVNRVSKLQIKL